MKNKIATISVVSLMSLNLVAFADGIKEYQTNPHSQNMSGKDGIHKEDSQQVYKAKNYTYLLGMPGFSDNALTTHFKLYQGYVTNTNLILSLLQNLTSEGKNRSPEFAELRRRFGWEFDGMRLHEYYFENLGGKGGLLDQNTALLKQINRDFGSYEAWKNDFVATGAMRGIGWAVLYLDPQNGKLVNTWINEHDVGHLAGGKPILIMDVFEHAYMLDYGLDRAKYIEAFFNNVNWATVNDRFAAVSMQNSQSGQQTQTNPMNPNATTVPAQNN